MASEALRNGCGVSAYKSKARNKPFTRSDIHDVARKDAWAKLIRLYREENDPLVMVFTAQKAMSLIKRNGYVPKRDVLHSMSVNYGGALVGLYAKHTFSRIKASDSSNDAWFASFELSTNFEVNTKLGLAVT